MGDRGARQACCTSEANRFAAAKVGAALSPPDQAERRVEGIVILSASHVLVDDTGVRQLGGLASELVTNRRESTDPAGLCAHGCTAAQQRQPGQIAATAHALTNCRRHRDAHRRASRAHTRAKAARRSWSARRQHEAFTVAAPCRPSAAGSDRRTPGRGLARLEQPANARESQRPTQYSHGRSVRSCPALANDNIRVLITASRAPSSTPVT